MTIKVGIIGATGYTGEVLLGILTHHPQVEITVVTSEKFAGKKVSDVFPHLKSIPLRFEKLSDPRIAEICDISFSCLPHKESATHVAPWIKQGLKVIDLSADFRLRSEETYEAWYQHHPAPRLLKEAVYGLPEFHRDEIRKAALVGNPGCYPTGALLGLIPLLQKRMISHEGIIIDAKSGISGAGRATVLAGLQEEADESVHAYKVEGHRHIPEMEQELTSVAGREVRVRFTPHLIPMHRGILTTLYAKTLGEKDSDGFLQVFRETYKGEPFIEILPLGKFPRTKDVVGTNLCQIGVHYDNRTQQVVVITAIDNLMKGASSQAVQNMNLMCGLDETAALK